MPIAVENIQAMREAIKKIDHAVYLLTNLFFVDIETKEVPRELLKKIHSYIVEMSMIIPEVRVYLDLLEIGLFHNVEYVVNRFRKVEDYIRKIDKSCGDLLKELGM